MYLSRKQRSDISRNMASHGSDQTYTYGKKRIEFGEIIDPLIRIPLKTLDTWTRVWFLVDTGADVTVIPIPLAHWFDIPFERSNKSTSVAGVGNDMTKAYPGVITIKIGRRQHDIRCYFVESGLDTMLLGRLDVFDHFTVVFDNLKKQLVFREILV